MSNVKILLLAAGSSSRMGRPKQLLPWRNTTLIEHQINILLALNFPVTVVLGAYSNEIQEHIKMKPITIFTNRNWKDGMGSSISFGLVEMLKKTPTFDGVCVALVDQPLLTKSFLMKMIDSFNVTGKHIIVSSSKDNIQGPPVLFPSVYFNELIKLKGDFGAKQLIREQANKIKLVFGGDELIDIDTQEEYNKFFDKI
ncbi:nucleotidyltransferase family protein [Urechidicola vernalis]|uniref:Nucleotidyltransferase family protein n=1 Tax=Urechidicola vernalis TaxID=3075600 RepID=A0ABU2Y4P8_9FLAO|nr:nucleotidyltransferase family protein [Urechidicola sp. P050]MDT0552629.1 nucleotidyltransferase family protein [Urechidicola sp. P050]